MKDLPAFSLDWILSKIYCEIIKIKLEKKDLEKNELIEAVWEACNQISENAIFNLVESKEREMIKCIENNGDRAPH